MSNLLEALEQVKKQLALTPEELQRISKRFRQAMADGLSGKPSSLKMLPSYLGQPSGTETGRFLALDFGGTNVRVLLTELAGDGSISVLQRASKPLKNPAGAYDYTSKEADGLQLFDFIASIIKEVVPPEGTYPLGHTFSYPINQTGLNSGTLIYWTKEIETRNVAGQEITQLLQEALIRNGLPQVQPQVILNDTVGTLLTAAYKDQTVDIGSICGTGHNTAYLEETAPQTNKPMIINMESGNFDQLPFTAYDDLLDSHSDIPGNGRLEKMVSGRYIGEVLRLILWDLLGKGLLTNSPDKEKLNTPYCLGGEDTAVFAGDTTAEHSTITHWLESKLGIHGAQPEDVQVIHSCAQLVAVRSARLVAATYLGIFEHIDPELKKPHTIAIDGSVYEKMPGFPEAMDTAFAQVLGLKAKQVSTVLSKDGSGLGAAIATAIAVKN